YCPSRPAGAGQGPSAATLREAERAAVRGGRRTGARRSAARARAAPEVGSTRVSEIDRPDEGRSLERVRPGRPTAGARDGYQGEAAGRRGQEPARASEDRVGAPLRMPERPQDDRSALRTRRGEPAEGTPERTCIEKEKAEGEIGRASCREREQDSEVAM